MNEEKKEACGEYSCPSTFHNNFLAEKNDAAKFSMRNILKKYTEYIQVRENVKLCVLAVFRSINLTIKLARAEIDTQKLMASSVRQRAL